MGHLNIPGYQLGDLLVVDKTKTTLSPIGHLSVHSSDTNPQPGGDYKIAIGQYFELTFEGNVSQAVKLSVQSSFSNAVSILVAITRRLTLPNVEGYLNRRIAEEAPTSADVRAIVDRLSKESYSLPCGGQQQSNQQKQLRAATLQSSALIGFQQQQQKPKMCEQPRYEFFVVSNVAYGTGTTIEAETKNAVSSDVTIKGNGFKANVSWGCASQISGQGSDLPIFWGYTGVTWDAANGKFHQNPSARIEYDKVTL